MTLDSILSNLNEHQKQAIQTIEGKIRVVAGAGSGKTRVLANRYAYLSEIIGIDPANIVCITFTNKAAQEMRNRIGKMVHGGKVNDFVCTIHSLCVKILRQEIYRIGFPKNFIILDQEDSKTFVKQAVADLKLEKENIKIDKRLDSISRNKCFKFSDYVEDSMVPNAPLSRKESAPFFYRFLELQLKHFALDYNDLIYFTIYILTHYKDALDFWQNKINFLQVDEVQDCSRNDWVIIELLSGLHKNLFIVGDPDQAIYEWRSAAPKLFVDFKSDKDIILNENYRSTQTILDVANSIIKNNKERIEKTLFTSKKDNVLTIYHHDNNDEAEGRWIAEQIDAQIKAGNKPSDFAILYRASYQSRFIEQALMEKKISYVIWGGIKFFERKEIKDSLAYLHMLTTADDLSFARIINLPSRKFGKATLASLQEIADKEGTSLYETLKSHKFDALFNKPSIRDFIDLIESETKNSKNRRISDTLDVLLKRSGLLAMYRNEGEDERLENIKELMQSIKYFESIYEDEETSLEKYLQEVSLFTNIDCQPNTPTVKLMTIHQSKGLEFPFVFVIGLTEGVFPSYKTIRIRRERGLEEERRLMYVAVTRAEKALFLTESEGYNFSINSNKYPSRFITEIGENLYKVDGNLDPELFARSKELSQDLEEEINPSTSGDHKEHFTIGAKVKHKILGEGEIVGYDEENETFTVKFGEQTYNILPRVIEPIE